MTEQGPKLVETRANLDLFSHARFLIVNKGFPANPNGKESSDQRVTRLVHYITEEVNQLVWVAELLPKGTGFEIRAFEGDAKDSKVLYSIHKIGCFDGTGGIVWKEDEKKKVSKLLGHIGKSLSHDMDKNS